MKEIIIKIPETKEELKEFNKHIYEIEKGCLKELESKKMIECLSPDSNKGKLYILTNYGKKVLTETSKL